MFDRGKKSTELEMLVASGSRFILIREDGTEVPVEDLVRDDEGDDEIDVS